MSSANPSTRVLITLNESDRSLPKMTSGLSVLRTNSGGGLTPMATVCDRNGGGTVRPLKAAFWASVTVATAWYCTVPDCDVPAIRTGYILPAGTLLSHEIVSTVESSPGPITAGVATMPVGASSNDSVIGPAKLPRTAVTVTVASPPRGTLSVSAEAAS